MSNVRYTKGITDLKNSQVIPEYISLFICICLTGIGLTHLRYKIKFNRLYG